MLCMVVMHIAVATPFGLPEVDCFFLFCPPPVMMALKWAQTCVNLMG